MNTIERIEARSKALPETIPEGMCYRVTRDEWSAIKAVIEAAKEAVVTTPHTHSDQSRIYDLCVALSKLEN